MSRRRGGYVLVPVVLMLTVIGAVAFLLSFEGAMGARMQGGEAEADAARYVAQAGLQHALWQLREGQCGGDFGLAATPLGAASYAATVTAGGSTSAYSLPADQDAWIRNDDTGSNNNGADQHIRFDGGNVEHALYRFDLSTLPAGAHVNYARAWFYIKGGAGSGEHPEGPIQVHRVLEDWTETGATWDSMGGRYETQELGQIPAQAQPDVWVSVELTAQVQAWVNAAEPNYGILLASISEGTHAKYLSSEGAEPPWLEVVAGSGAASPAQLAATGTLASGISRTLTRVGVPAAGPGQSFVPPVGFDLDDTYGDGFSQFNNFGSSDRLRVGDAGTARFSLIHFDLFPIPSGAEILSAQLWLNLESVGGAPAGAEITAYRMVQPWTENGANWWTSDGFNLWSWPSPGHPVATLPFESPATGWHAWDIRSVVEDWSKGVHPNLGLVLGSDGGVNNARFTSSDDADPALHPRIDITYACECGSPCLAPRGSGNVLMVVGNPWSLTPADVAVRDLLEDWGYVVDLIQDDDSQGNFDSGLASNDVVYVSESISANNVGSKLTGATIGVVSAEGNLNDELGISSSRGAPNGSSVDVVDTAHYVTAVFTPGSLPFKTASMQLQTVGGSVASGAQALAEIGGVGSVVVLETGASLEGGGNAAGRRVLLPIGEADYDPRLTAAGQLVLQRSLAWAQGVADAPPALLMVVVNPSSLLPQEDAKKTLIESWGWAVTLIDESASQAAFDAAVASNDVVYIVEDVQASQVGSKLVSASIGVVTEEDNLSDEFGLSDGIHWGSGTGLKVTNTHYITETLPEGSLTLFTSVESLADLTSSWAPDLQELGKSLNGPALVSVEAGGALISGGTAAGRRVQLPWGGNDFDLDHLNDDGRTIMRRAIEWGAGASSGGGGAGAPRIVLTTEDSATLGGLDFTGKDLADYDPDFDSATLLLDGAAAGLSQLIDAVHILENGHLVLSPTDSMSIGGVFAHDEDLVDYDPVSGTGTLLFDGSDAFTAGLTDVNGVHVMDDGKLLLANVYTATIGGIEIEPEDIALWDPTTGTATLYLDGSANSVQRPINAIHLLENGNLALSFWGMGWLGSLHLEEGDIAEFDPDTGEATFYLDGDAAFGADEDVRALHVGDGSGAVAVGPVAYVELFETWWPSSSGTWQTIDLTARGVPANAVVEIAVMQNSGNAERWAGVRAAGSSLERRFRLHEAEGGGNDVIVMHVQTNASAHIQQYADNTNNIVFALLGYWTGVTYEERFDAFTAGGSGSWRVRDLSGYGVGPNQVAEIAISNTSTSAERLGGVRGVGTAVQRRLDLHEAESGGVEVVSMMVGAGASSDIEVYAESDADVDFHLLGYWSTPPGSYVQTGGVHGSPVSSASWHSGDVNGFGVPPGAVLQMVVSNESTSNERELGIRATGSAHDRRLELQEAESGGADVVGMHVNVDGSGRIEIYSESTSDSYFYPIGWWVIP